MSERPNQDVTIGADQSTVGAVPAAKGSYAVGRGRPPKEYRWQKGQSGNPSGRPRKKQNKKAVLEQIMNEAVVIREDGKQRKVTKYDALFRSHMAKGIKGDARSAKLFMEEAARVGLGEEQEGGFSALLPPQIQSVPSDALFANLNLDLLTDDDKIELARLGQIIDLGSDFTALSERDFELAKQIANKGRGKDVTPQQVMSRTMN
jgi:Family of unknown function (DUF5681)